MRRIGLLAVAVLFGALAPARGEVANLAARIDEAAAKKSAEAHGYSDVRQLLRDGAGTWRGVAWQYGRWSRFEIDTNGNFIASAIDVSAKPTPR